MPEIQTFSLNISCDGNFVAVDYNDGSDVEHYPVSSQDEVQAVVAEAVRTALSPEED